MSWLFGIGTKHPEMPPCLAPSQQDPSNPYQQQSEVKVKAARDVKLRSFQASEEERQRTIVEQIKTCGTVIGAGLKEFINDRKKIITTVGGLTALAVGFYTAKRGSDFGAKFIEAIFGKPSLVRETSCFSRIETFKHPIKVTRKIFRAKGDPLKDVVLDPSLESGLRDIAITTKNTNNGRLPNAGDIYFVEASEYDMPNPDSLLLTDIDEKRLTNQCASFFQSCAINIISVPKNAESQY
uniref:ATPase family AAA domain-containing protein n=1 Tax=Panagrolaimus davidi TaxID=227884 RepID=A0A914Q2B5_9BILA